MGSCLSVAGAPSDACDDRLWSPTELSDYRIEMRVHRVPGRLFLNGSSQIASLYCRKGYGEINQDAMLVWDNFCSNDGTVLCGVFDGHGPYGHLVAKKLRDSFPLKLMAQWNSSNPDSTYSNRNFFSTSMNNDLEPCTIAPTEIATLRQSFITASKIMDRDLRIQNQIDCSSSGSTAVTLLKQVSITSQPIPSHHFTLSATFFNFRSFIPPSLHPLRATTFLLLMWVTPELYWLPMTAMVPLLPFSLPLTLSLIFQVPLSYPPLYLHPIQRWIFFFSYCFFFIRGSREDKDL